MSSPAGNRRSWADLPPEILQSIAEPLDLVSSIRCHAVCSAWAAAFSGAHTSHPPFLLLPSDPIDNKATNYNLFDLSNSKSYQIRVPSPSLIHRWVGSSDGWLVTEDNSYRLNLLNPFSGSLITIPASFYGYFLLKVIICYTPNHMNGFLLLAVLSSGRLAFLKTEDKAWTLLRDEETFKDAIFYNGKVYALSNQGHLCTWDITDISSPKFEKVSSNTVQEYERCKLAESEGGKILSATEERYLLESGKELVMVIRERVCYRQRNDEISTEDIVRVLRFDPVRAEWGPVCNLDSFALFLGGNIGYSIPVLNNSSHGFRGNCVYFIDSALTEMEDCETVNSCVEEFNLGEGTSWIYHQNYNIVMLPEPIWFRPALF